MKILVAIANFGTGNRQYLERLLAEYEGMPWQVDIVVLSNIPKPDLANRVEVVVGLPSSNPWSLPFAHKKIFAKRLASYDLFIYSEDDTLISQSNLEAFLRSLEVLKEDELAGFVRLEQGADGEMYCSTMHTHFRWIPDSVRLRGGDTWAHFTNEHSAAFVLTREQLGRALERGFVCEPHEGRYDMLCSAATDPYTRCGFTKLINVSQFEDFCIRHLPDKYVGRMGVGEKDWGAQLNALVDLAAGRGSRKELVAPETRVRHAWWSVNYWALSCPEALDAFGETPGCVLSFGCRSGHAEEPLLRRGCRVIGIPVDAVIGRCAERRGIVVTSPELDAGLAACAGETIDGILVHDILHLFPNPEEILGRLVGTLRPGGRCVVTSPNLGGPIATIRRLRGEPGWRELANPDRAGLHVTSGSMLRDWLRSAGLKDLHVTAHVEGRARKLDAATGGLLRSILGQQLVAIGTR